MNFRLSPDLRIRSHGTLGIISILNFFTFDTILHLSEFDLDLDLSLNLDLDIDLRLIYRSTCSSKTNTPLHCIPRKVERLDKFSLNGFILRRYEFA